MSWTNFKKPVLLIFSFVLLTIIGIAQSANSVTITVSSTEYDNPSLTGLKEYLKANSKVKGLKSTFTNSIATLSFTYSGTADELWDEIPANKKQAFKLSSIDSNTIKLQLAKSSPVSTTSNKADAKNCGCDYFPLCNYDGEKNFQGEKWKLMNYDGKSAYYHCENGKLRIKTLRHDWDGNFVGYVTFTALKQNEPKGTTWSESLDLGGGITRTYTHVIVKKDIRVKLDGKIYNDVIKVHRNAGEVIGNTYGGVEKGYTYYIKDVGAFEERKITELPDDDIEVRLKSNVEHPLFLKITEFCFWYTNIDVTGYSQNNPVIKESFIFNKDGSFTKGARRKYNDYSELSEGFWSIKDGHIELMFKTNEGNWSKYFEVIQSSKDDIKLKDLRDKYIFLKRIGSPRDYGY
jgi:hypothetical protein